MLRNEWIESENHRCSTRTYTNKKLEQEAIDSLNNLINEISKKEPKLNFRFIDDCSDFFEGFKASYGLIKGVNSCIALIGDKDTDNLKNKIGYYGEMLVLEATSMGLGTCWIGGTYNRQKCENYLNMFNIEELICVIAIGYPANSKSLLEKLSNNMFKKKKNFNEILLEKDDELSNWVVSGINSVIKAPSAVNRKPVGFYFKNSSVNACTVKDNLGFEEIDLGISMLHFELGAKKEGYNGNWNYIDGEHIYK